MTVPLTATRGKIRILVVEDSLTVRRHLCDLLASDPELSVIGEGEDGIDAIELCRTLKPDVVTMDMMMPVMNGLTATEYIMAHCPTPILIVSASTNRGDLFKTYEALAAGAVDVLEKSAAANDLWAQRFRSTVKMVARIRVITHPRARLAGYIANLAQEPQPMGFSPRRFRLVAVGASTGGPGAIVELLRALPLGFPLPLVLVLHISEPFGVAFAGWLDGQSHLRVAFARDGEPFSSAAGRVVMAPPGQHLSIADGRFRLTREAERHSCRPSVDVLFESVAKEFGRSAAACLLTGMGRDGAAGLLRIRTAGGFTIAQDEATSVVYGMPREAVLLGAAEHVLPLSGIGPAVARLAAMDEDGG